MTEGRQISLREADPESCTAVKTPPGAKGAEREKSSQRPINGEESAKVRRAAG